MSGARTVKIDGEKLKRELEKRGVTLINASIAIYSSFNYLNVACERGVISYIKASSLENEFGIPLSAYRLDTRAVATKPVATIKEHTTHKRQQETQDRVANKELIYTLNSLGITLEQFKTETTDMSLETAIHIESIEKNITEIAVSLRLIGNLLTQINEKCMKR